jgi:hypothetical protein
MRPGDDDGSTAPGDDPGDPESSTPERSIIDEWVDGINRDLDARNASVQTRLRRWSTPRRVIVGAVLVAVIVGAWFLSVGLAVAIAVVAALAVMSAIITTPKPDIAVHGLGSSKYQTDRAPVPPHVGRI